MESLLVVIVLYKQRLASSRAYTSLKNAEQSLYDPVYWVWDNSPNKDSAVLTSGRLFYQHQPENAGVSKAYNEAFIAAKKINAQWILLTDQDSDFPEDTFTKADQTIQQNRGIAIFSLLMKDKHGIVSPFQWKAGRGIRVKNLCSGVYATSDWCIINSGMLIARTLFEKCGGYDERFPLDLSDVVFFNKVKDYSKSFYLLPVEARHSLSDDDADYKNTLERFKIYCISLMRYFYTINNNFNVQFVLIRRAAKLSLVFCSLSFMAVAVQCLRKHRKEFL